MNDLDNFNNFTLLKMFNLQEKNIEDFKVYHVPVKDKEGKVLETILNIDVKLMNQKTSYPICDCEKYTIKGYVDKKLKHSIIKNQKCVINYKARRYQCSFCRKTFYEYNPFALNSMRYTLNTVYNVLGDLKAETETFASVAKRHNISVNTAISIFDNYVNISRNPLSSVICIDEVYAFKSQKSKYVCVLLDYHSQEIIDVLPSRTLADLRSYLRLIPREERDIVKLVSIDMWHTYKVITREYFRHAKCAVDKFHVFQDFTRKVNRVRIKEMNEFKPLNDKPANELTSQEASERYRRDINYYLLKKFHWLLFKRDAKYSDPNYHRRYNQKMKRRLNYYEIRELIFEASPVLLECVNLQHHLRQFYDLDYNDAKQNINILIERFKNSNIHQMNEFANTLTTWKHEIVNSFTIVDEENQKKVNNAIIENRNKSIKTIKRNGNGYTNWNRFRNRVMYSVNKHSTHYLYSIKKDKKK